jgi:hypothetical protein
MRVPGVRRPTGAGGGTAIRAAGGIHEVARLLEGGPRGASCATSTSFKPGESPLARRAGIGMGAASYQRRVMAALAVPPKLERPVLPGPGVVRLVDPALGVFLSQFQQARRELAGEEQVAEELAPARVSAGADQPAEQVEIN